MAVGVTGTQQGMTTAQHSAALETLTNLHLYEGHAVLHHGDCIGADASFHGMARMLGMGIVIHPPINPDKRAYCTTSPGDLMWTEREYMDRNQDIVDSVGALVAAPSGPEVLRSGTWATIRRARKRGIEIFIVWPDGSVTEE